MTRRAAKAARALAVLTTYAVLLGGCGGSPEPIGPAGIDGLTNPTPSPHPLDFTDRVDNPWFPLAPGARWTYRAYSTTSQVTDHVRVLDAPVVVDGVETVAVRVTTTEEGRTTFSAERWYAQDAAGNVWWFGQRARGGGSADDVLAPRSWRAGTDGAVAGLMMSARPRLGDGYENGYLKGVFERRATVRSLTGVVAMPHRSYHGTLETQDESGTEPNVVVTSFYARGIGLVSRDTVVGGTTQVALVRYRAP
jgi:hypothetical protein